MVNHGQFDVLITPDHCGECLISTDQLNSSGHVITMTNTETIIADVLHRYVLRYPREPGNRDYPVPLDVLHRISELRKQYPLTNTAQAAMREPYKIPRITQPSRFRYSRYLSTLLNADRAIPQLSHVRSGRLRTIPQLEPFDCKNAWGMHPKMSCAWP